MTLFTGVSAQDFKPENSQKVRIAEQRPPTQIRVFKQSCRLHFANLSTMAVQVPRVINDPIQALRLEIRLSHKHHGVERLMLHGLVEKEQIAGTRRSEIARNQECVVTKERGAIHKFAEGALHGLSGGCGIGLWRAGRARRGFRRWCVRPARRLSEEERSPRRPVGIVTAFNIAKTRIERESGLFSPCGRVGHERISEGETNQGSAILNFRPGTRRRGVVLRFREKREPVDEILTILTVLQSR